MNESKERQGMKEGDYTAIVTPDEMQDTRQWLTDRLEAWTDEGSPHAATIVCKAQGWGTLKTGRSVTGGALCLDGRTYNAGLGTHADSEIVVRRYVTQG